MKTPERLFPGWRTAPRNLAQWAVAALGAAAAVALLAAMFFTGLTVWQPGWRVAQAPALTHERAIAPDEARRKADDTRILVR